MTHHDHFIEQLSEIATVRGFLTLAKTQLHQQVELLTQRVFRKTDFALKSVVNSLFEHQGPLAELNVQLKLLLGLGVISAELYQDINAFVDIQCVINNEADEPHFTSSLIIHFAQKLHFVDLSLLNELLKHSFTAPHPDSMLLQMQQLRLEKIIRSSLIIALTQMLEQLDVESPL